MPHHEKRDPAETSKELQNQVPADLIVLGIDARSGCLGSPGNWKAIGSGKVTVYRGCGLASLPKRADASRGRLGGCYGVVPARVGS